MFMIFDTILNLWIQNKYKITIRLHCKYSDVINENYDNFSLKIILKTIKFHIENYSNEL